MRGAPGSSPHGYVRYRKGCRCDDCRAGHAAYLRSYRARHPEVTRRINLKAAHGLSGEQYDAMHAAQGGLCAVCRGPETANNQHGPIPLAVDHCHDSGVIRGLLCGACNRAAGFLRHDTARIRALAEYLDNARLLGR